MKSEYAVNFHVPIPILTWQTFKINQQAVLTSQAFDREWLCTARLEGAATFCQSTHKDKTWPRQS